MNNNYSIQAVPATILKNDYYMVFKLASNLYAINIKYIFEIINIPEMEMPELMPKGVIGMFNYNGNIIKAIDLCPFLGLETRNFDISNQIIIVISNDDCFALNTDKIVNITQFDSDKIQKIPYENDTSILKYLYKSNESIINIIEIDLLKKLLFENNSLPSLINYKNLFPSDDKSLQLLKLRANKQKVIQDVFAFPVDLNTNNQYILFTLDNQNYFLDLKYIKEFISVKRLNITKLPYVQDCISGIVSIQGEILVVINLKKFLNPKSDDSTESTKLIVVEGRNFNIAFLVDDIKYIKNLKNVNSINSSKINRASSDYILSEFLEEDVLYNILNFEKIINDERIYIDIA